MLGEKPRLSRSSIVANWLCSMARCKGVEVEK